MVFISLSGHGGDLPTGNSFLRCKTEHVPTAGTRLHDLYFKINVKKGLFLHQGYLQTVAFALTGTQNVKTSF